MVSKLLIIWKQTVPFNRFARSATQHLAYHKRVVPVVVNLGGDWRAVDNHADFTAVPAAKCG